MAAVILYFSCCPQIPQKDQSQQCVSLSLNFLTGLQLSALNQQVPIDEVSLNKINRYISQKYIVSFMK